MRLYVPSLPLLALVFGSVAYAAPITFQLSNLTFERGVSATGSFRYDFANNSVSNINIVVSGPSTGFNNFFVNGSVLFNVLQPDFRAPSYIPQPGELTEGFLPAGSTQNSIRAQMGFISTFLSLTQPTSVNGAFPPNYAFLAIFGNPNVNLRLTSGQLVADTSVPEPGSYIAGFGLAAILYLRGVSRRVNWTLSS